MSYYNYNSLKNILNNFVKLHEYDELLMQYNIEKYLYEQTNNNFKNSIKITGYKEKKLTIRTSSSTWRFELNMRKENLISLLNQKFGENTVNEIIIH